MVYVRISKCSRNPYISGTYERIHSCKLHLLQNILLKPLHTSANDGKDVGNISGSHLVNVFSVRPLHSQWRLYHNKSTVPGIIISGQEKCKNLLEPVQGSMGEAKKSLNNRQVSWSIVVKWKKLLVLHFSGRFLLTASLRQRRISVYNFAFTVAISVNYISEIL
jgi:hypothetical protein